MKVEEISHKGRIVSIGQYVTEVEIIRKSACSSCHARRMCAYSDAQVKVVPVPTDALGLYGIGDEVELCMKTSMGMKAVWVAYVIPLILLIAAVLVASACGLDELAVGLVAVAAVALYYIVILCMRRRLENEFVFYIK